MRQFGLLLLLLGLALAEDPFDQIKLLAAKDKSAFALPKEILDKARGQGVAGKSALHTAAGRDACVVEITNRITPYSRINGIYIPLGMFYNHPYYLRMSRYQDTTPLFIYFIPMGQNLGLWVFGDGYGVIWAAKGAASTTVESSTFPWHFAVTDASTLDEFTVDRSVKTKCAGPLCPAIELQGRLAFEESITNAIYLMEGEHNGRPLYISHNPTAAGQLFIYWGYQDSIRTWAWALNNAVQPLGNPAVLQLAAAYNTGDNDTPYLATHPWEFVSPTSSPLVTVTCANCPVEIAGPEDSHVIHGVYIPEGRVNGRPLYHEHDTHLYLYWHAVDGSWMIGKQADGDCGLARVFEDTWVPQQVTKPWQIWNPEAGNYVKGYHIRADCAKHPDEHH